MKQDNQEVNFKPFNFTPDPEPPNLKRGDIVKIVVDNVSQIRVVKKFNKKTGVVEFFDEKEEAIEKPI